MALVQKQLGDLITYTRGSTGMEFNSVGVLAQSEVNQLRFDYDPLTLAIKGFLVEEAKTNLLTRTNSIFAWSVLGGISAQRDGTRFVDGIRPMIKLVEDLDANGHTAQLTGSSDILADTTYTISFFAKTAGRNLNLSMSNGWAAPDFPSMDVNLTDFTFTTTGGAVGMVKPMGGGMCRVSLTVTRGPTPYIGHFVVRPVNAAGQIAYSGDGVSGVYVGGWQIEAGAVVTSYIPSAYTFTSRSSTANYFDLNKTLKTAAVNEARSLAYGWDSKGYWKPQGLLEEHAATNLALQSNSATTFSTLLGATYVDNGQLFVDGTSPLRKLVESNDNRDHNARQLAVLIPGALTTYTSSFIVKAAERTKLRMLSTAGRIDFDLTAMTCTVLSSYAVVGRIEKLGDGFVRISITARTTVDNTSITNYIYLLDNLGAAIYQGDGVSGLFVGGYQVEVGTSASSYIPTTNTQVTRAMDVVAVAQATRAADVPVINDLGEWYNQSEGTLYVEAIPLGVPSGIYACLNAGNLNNRLQVDSVTAGNRLTLVAGGSTQVSAVATPIPVAGQVQKIAVAFKNDDFALCSNGGVARLDTVGTLPAMTRLSLMSATIGGQPNAHLRMIKYFPRRLTDAELQALTA